MVEYKTKEQKRKFYDSGEWKKLRAKIKQRDNYECQECKRKGIVSIDTNEYSESARRKKIQLVVHHIKELEHHPELALYEDNLETVCVDCHNKEHGRDFSIKKPNKWQHDERW
ncbi:HNH endonuclease [Lysinibacillus capsici]|uniref:HNH endonuclease n=1 Tax=Lysinibacillus capsici TaxID=2115968 RepID=UPI001C113633|nr:HNH endonuclease [Lysinibacillus capsici]MBU5250779.1 HNH endonuclease [Lysinibacillus capsici]